MSHGRDAGGDEEQEFARLQDLRDRRVLLLGLCLVMTAYGLGAALQTSILFSEAPGSARSLWGEGANFGTRMLANGSAVTAPTSSARLSARPWPNSTMMARSMCWNPRGKSRHHRSTSTTSSQ